MPSNNIYTTYNTLVAISRKCIINDDTFDAREELCR